MKSNTYLLGVLALVVGIFIYFLFKNIQYPLIWADEADTVVVGERVLKFGYPKISDGTNVLPPFWKGVTYQKFDILLHPAWIQYYIAAPALFIAGKFSDIYLQTQILRIPFALVGLLGVLILPLFIFRLFTHLKNKIVFLILYFVIQIISISLILHLREVREYSAVILLSATLVNLFIQYFILGNKTHGFLLILMFLNLSLLFFSMIQIPYIFIMSFLMFILINFFFANSSPRRNWRNLINFIMADFKQRNLLFMLTGWLLLSLPLIVFFDLLGNMKIFNQDMQYNMSTYFSYLVRILTYLNSHHYLTLFIILKIILIYLCRKSKQKDKLTDDIYPKGLKISFYLLALLLSYLIIISKSPWLFDRYYVFLLPLLTVMILLDLFLIRNLLKPQKNMLLYFGYYIGLVFVLSSIGKVPMVLNYWYQLNHRYVGPLDAFISYVQDHYPDPSQLKIFTNTEQYNLEYYLHSQAVCSDYATCFDTPPDIILPRNFLATPTDDYLKKGDEYLRTNSYRKVSLNILNYPVNNIPELSLVLKHLFSTPTTSNQAIQLTFYELQKNDQ